MKTIDSINFNTKRALIRVDFNVPLNAKFEVTDDTRIRAAIPTIQKIINDGGSVVLMSHLGRPKDGFVEKYSLKHTITTIEKLLGTTVQFAPDCEGTEALRMANNLKAGEVLLVENLRFHTQEEKGDVQFASQLALLGNVYVNDAFGTAHRAHASTTIIAQCFDAENKCFGYVMASEIANADKLLKNNKKPFVAIVGGAKVSDKILIIENLLNNVNTLIIGGGMAYTFFKAMGHNIGTSLCEMDKLELAKSIIEKAKDKNVKLLLPIDHIVADGFSNDANTQVALTEAMPNGMMGLDIGPLTQKLYAQEIANAKTILWNGPMGVFEMEKFQYGTKAVALAVAKATANGAYSLIGGGDSVAAINKYELANQVSYVSTGGGALLEYIEGKTLPGIAAIGLN
ncbi:MAG: phosphoglycerate kinase [Bacteroidia bacterium]|nr:phosphoglycerate kinase [Bacteroidia bacterium]